MAHLLSNHRRKLLQWFGHEARTLPWRANRDPYRIWVSEVMLQQTTVATVAPRFEQFINFFPTVQALAAATEQEVLKQWEGLGYYRRARHLHQAAKIIVAEHGGSIPNDPEHFAALPGVGKYIVGAVLSQAFDQRLPIVEANTRRLLCRLFGQTGDPKSREIEQWLWQKAAEILPKKEVGDFNQGLMELGALICTPNNPKCGECPLRSCCIAYRDGLQESIPRRVEAPATEEVREVCVVPVHNGRVLLMRRGTSGRWANMWEFPRLEVQARESVPRVMQRFRADYGLHGKRPTQLLTIHYAVTRFRIAMNCFLLPCSEATHTLGAYVEGQWLAPSELANYPVSTAQRKLANLIAERFSETGLEAQA